MGRIIVKRRVVLLLVVAVVARLLLAALPPVTDATEARYAQISQEMVLSGDWVTPRLWVEGEQVPFLGKPPLFFWLAAACVAVLGSSEMAVRLPGLVAAALLLVLLYVVLRLCAGSRVAVNATWICATSVLFLVLCGAVVLDMVLTLFVAGALLSYLAFARRRGRAWSLSVFLCLAGGVLTKGPVALVLFGLPVLAWTGSYRRWGLLRDHAWGAGVPLFLLLVAPWFVLAEVDNPGFLRYFFVNENLLRYVTPDYGDLYGDGHRFPRGTAVLMFAIATLPWSVVGARVALAARWRQALRDEVTGFFLLGFVANVVFWCFARQLLVTYMLPMVPMFAGWVALCLGTDRRCSRRVRGIALTALLAVGVMLVAVLPLASSRSTRTVLRRSDEIAARLGLDGRVVFHPVPPESAYFYARGRVAPATEVAGARVLAAPVDTPAVVIGGVNAELTAMTPGWSLWVLEPEGGLRSGVVSPVWERLVSPRVHDGVARGLEAGVGGRKGPHALLGLALGARDEDHERAR